MPIRNQYIVNDHWRDIHDYSRSGQKAVVVESSGTSSSIIPPEEVKLTPEDDKAYDRLLNWSK